MKCCHTVSFCLSEKENHNCRNRRITRPRVCCKNINPWNSWQVPAATISTVETDGIAVLRIVIRKIVGPQHKFKVVRGTVRCIKEHRQVSGVFSICSICTEGLCREPRRSYFFGCSYTELFRNKCSSYAFKSSL